MTENYSKNARRWRNCGITADDITLYPVDLDEIDDEILLQKLKDFFDLDIDESTAWLTREDIEKFDIDDNLVDWNFGEYDEEEHEEILRGLVKEASHYLVFAHGCRWNGASGYAFYDTCIKTLYRPYDVTLTVNGVSPDGKVLKLTEASHDVPTGNSTYVIALNTAEYKELFDGDFEDVSDFVSEMSEKVEE